MLFMSLSVYCITIGYDIFLNPFFILSESIFTHGHFLLLSFKWGPHLKPTSPTHFSDPSFHDISAPNAPHCKLVSQPSNLPRIRKPQSLKSKCRLTWWVWLTELPTQSGLTWWDQSISPIQWALITIWKDFAYWEICTSKGVEVLSPVLCSQ